MVETITGARVVARLQPGRRVWGACALLVPFREDAGAARMDLDGWHAQMARVLATGLTPAVNMDTGYVQRLGEAEQDEILRAAGAACQGRPFICGAPAPEGGEPLEARYRRRVEAIVSAGGTPIIFPGPEMRALEEEAVVALHAAIARDLGDGVGAILAFELGPDFVPWGRIYSLATVARLMAIPGLAGMKHSSLNRRLEWARLELRDRERPAFRVMTGNDLAIDMTMYGSDYLLGLAAFHPQAFAQRDAWWADGDARFYELDDALQALGAFAFRTPVPAYKHSAAQFLALRGVIPPSAPPPGEAQRPASDVEVLRVLLDRIEGTAAASAKVNP